MHVVGRDRGRPGSDPALVVVLLDRPPPSCGLGRCRSCRRRAVSRARPRRGTSRRAPSSCNLSPKLKMWPTSIAVWNWRAAAALGTAVALERLADVGEARLVVAARLDAAQMCQPSRFAPATNSPSRSVSSAITSTVEPDRADRAAGRAERLRGSPPPSPAGGRLRRRHQLLLAQPVVATEEREHDAFRRRSSPASPWTWPRRRCPGTPASASHRVDAGRLDLLRLAEDAAGSSGARGMPCAISRRRVVAVLAAHERVLARARGREEAERSVPPMTPLSALTAYASTPHRSKIRLYASGLRSKLASSPSSSRSNEYASFMMNSRTRRSPPRGRGSSRSFTEKWYQSCGSSLYERISRAWNVIVSSCVNGRRKSPPVAVRQVEDLGIAIAPGLLPELGRRQQRAEHLLAADRVHLLADDLLDLPVHPPAERQVVHRPVPTCRMKPPRTRSLWLAASASAGSSRRVGRKSCDARIRAG